MKYIANLSGGKDSTAMLLMLLEKGMQVDYIVFADTGKDFPQMRDHLAKLELYLKEHHPEAPAITYLKADYSFDYLMFEHEKTKGKRKGERGYGWATMFARWCTMALKTLFIHYPELWAELREMDARANNQFRADYSVADLEAKFLKELSQQQISICGVDLAKGADCCTMASFRRT